MAPDRPDNGNDHMIDSIYRIVGQVEKRFDDLREADMRAVMLAHQELSLRLEGFPAQFATKVEAEQAALTLRKLENEALSREIYEGNRQAMLQAIATIDRDKLNRSVYDTFIENYRLEQEREAGERRGAAELLANAASQVRAQFMEERSDFVTQEAYDNQHQAIVRRVEGVERWQYKIIGGLVFATFLGPLITGMVVYFITRGL